MSDETFTGSTQIGSVTWYHDTTWLGETPLYFSYSQGGSDPYSEAYSNLTCLFGIEETEVPNKIDVNEHRKLNHFGDL